MRKFYSLFYLFLLIFLFIKVDAQTHFTPVGDFTSAMNVNLLEAKVNGVNLVAGDEIAVFDGDICVGVVVLTTDLGDLLDAKISSVAAGADDSETPEQDGFKEGNTILFRMWDASEMEEITSVDPTYVNISDGSTIEAPVFTIGPSTFVSLSATHNYTPKANAGADFSINENSTGQIDGSASSDLDGSDLTFSWQDLDGLGLSSLNAEQPTFTAPLVTSDTEYEVVLTVNDGAKNSLNDTVVVTVLNIPLPPEANAGEDFEVNELEQGQLDGTSSSDPDGLDITTYSWEIVPSGFAPDTPDAATSDFTAPSVTSDTEYFAILTVTNTVPLSDKDTVVVTVKNVNQKPIADAGPDQSVGEGVTVNLDGSGSNDPDDGPGALIYQWTEIDPVMLNDDQIASPSFTSESMLKQDGTYRLKLVVSDGDLFSEPDTVVITVNHTNINPVADAGSDFTVDESTQAQLDASGSSDWEDEILTYDWTAPAGVELSDAAIAMPTFTTPEVEKDTTYAFYLKVTDTDLAIDKDTVEVTVKQVNKVPIANAGMNQEVDEDVLVTLDGSASYDPDKLDNITFSWVAPVGITLDDPNAESPTFTSPFVIEEYVDYEFKLIVNDGTENSVEDKVTVRVIHLNIAPVADAGPDIVLNELVAGQLDGSNSSDHENKPLTYSWEDVDGLGLSALDIVDPTFTTPEVHEDTDFEVVLIVNDGVRSSEPDTMVVSVKQLNKKPIANAGQDQEVDENVLVTLDASGSSDADQLDVITYLWTAPLGITLDDNTAEMPTFTTPWFMKDSVLTFQLVVNDGFIDSETDEVSILVKHANLKPTANAGMDILIDENGQGQLIGVVSSDPENATLSYNWTAPDGFVIDNPTAISPTFTAPEVHVNTDFEIVLVVDDGELINNIDKDTVVVSVNHINKPPVANAGDDFVAREQKEVMLDGSGSSDPDELDILQFSWLAPSGVILNDPSSETPTFTSPVVSENTDLMFILSIADAPDKTLPLKSSLGTIWDDKDTVVVTITPNHEPIANAGADQTVYSSQLVTLHGEGSSDQDNDELTYIWSTLDGITLSDVNSASPTFTAPLIDDEQTYTFNLEVSDDLGLKSTDQVVITVVGNQPPVAYALEDNWVTEGDTITLDATGSTDPDRDKLTYLWKTYIANEADLIDFDDETSATPTFIVPYVEEDRTIKLKLIVSDGYHTSSIIISIHIANIVNNLPVANAGDDLMVNEGDEFTLDGSASMDSDEDDITFEWSLGDLADETVTTETITIIAPEVDKDTTVPVILVVNDGLQNSEPDTIWVTIKQVNKSPEFVELPTETALFGYAYADTIVVTDADQLDTISIEVEGLPEWINFTDLGDGMAVLHTDSVPRDDQILGSHTVTIVATDGTDEISETLDIVVDIKTGVLDLVVGSVEVYPNPTHGKVYIEFDRQPSDKTMMYVYNNTGQLIIQQQVVSHSSSINLQGNPNGLYYVRIVSETDSITEKVILK